MVRIIGKQSSDFSLYEDIDFTDALESIMDDSGVKKANVFF